MKTLIAALAALVLTTSSAFAAIGSGCATYTQVTPNNAPVSHTGQKPGNLRSHGYAGIPGQFGCPIKAAPGTCVDPTKSLSDPELGGAIFTYVTLDGEVPDIYTHRNYIQIGPVKIYGPEKPGAC